MQFCLSSIAAQLQEILKISASQIRDSWDYFLLKYLTSILPSKIPP